MEKRKLFGLTLEELQGVAAEVGLARFGAKQMADWLYRKCVGDVGGMTNLSLKVRERLSEGYEVGRRVPEAVLESADGTRKMLFDYGGRAVETAYIPDGTGERNTLCVSSQVGCKMGCKFCMTGRQGFGGNLSAGEILNQMASTEGWEALTNMVFMGMGEPMDNIGEVLKALRVLTEPWGYGWSPRRITVSTIGVIGGLKRLLDESEVHVAISLHSADSIRRQELMPAEKGFPMSEVMELLSHYDWTGQRRLTFEYTMFAGVNDSMGDVERLVKMLAPMRWCRVNLIAFNQIPDSDLKGCGKKRMEWFRDMLNAKGVTATIRQSKGQDIEAACGMLSTKRDEGR